MEPTPGMKIAERIALVAPLASGSMGAVWVAQHETLKTRVAVKLLPRRTKQLHRSAEQRFALEASAAARIQSPHVVRMFDHGVMADGTMFIVMELLSGESLAERMQRVGALSVDDTITIVEQCCKGLAAAHAQGLVHRDIKPANIFLTDEHGELFVKVLDFGVVKELDPRAPTLSEPGMLLGTPAYMSRDAIRRQGGETKPGVDLWSLCVVAYRCLTGQLPFRGDEPSLVLRAILRGEHDPPSKHGAHLGPEVDAWFARAFDLDEERRIGDAMELATSFRELFAPKQAEVPAARRRTRWPLGLVLIVGAAAGGYLAMRPPPPPPAPPPPRAPSSAPAPAPPPASAPAPAASRAMPAPPASVSRADAARAAALEAKRQKWEVFVPAGDVVVGGAKIRVAHLYIDRTEVTVRSYAACVVARACSDRRLQGPTVEAPTIPRSASCNWHQVGREDYPMNCVSFPQAESYCRWRNARLPNEAEWMRGARADDLRPFVWGDEPASCDRTVMADADGQGCGRGTSWIAGTRPEDVSPFGALDLGGNLREWVSDWTDATRAARVVKGGSFADDQPEELMVTARRPLPPTERSTRIGFRCTRSAE